MRHPFQDTAYDTNTNVPMVGEATGRWDSDDVGCGPPKTLWCLALVTEQLQWASKAEIPTIMGLLLTSVNTCLRKDPNQRPIFQRVGHFHGALIDDFEVVKQEEVDIV